jgi:hypothetical protein
MIRPIFPRKGIRNAEAYRVVIFSLLCVADGLLGVIVGIIMFMLSYLETAFFAELMLISLVWVILGIGLWRKKNWARWTSIILVLGGLLTQIAFAMFLPSAFGLSWRHMRLADPYNIIHVLMVIYLITPKVKHLFLSPDAGAQL